MGYLQRRQMKKKVTIIAEIGVNHNGDLDLARKLIDAAVIAQVDYVKFQTFRANRIASQAAKMAVYQKENAKISGGSQYDMLKNLELTENDHIELQAYCKRKNVKFLSSAFDIDSLDFLNNLGLELFKVPSGEITNYPYLKKLASFGKPVIVSTGMCTMNEIKDALRVLISDKLSKKDITILHCNTEYPTPMEDVNLKAMRSIADEFEIAVGYSDHTLGIEVPIAAVALGATVIEKHFTLDRTLPGPDHNASLEPDELKAMVLAIRNIELALGEDGIKKPTNSERKNIDIVRKSIHLNKSIREGEVLTDKHLIALRPGDGISPMLWEKVMGRKVNKDLPKGHKLRFEDFI